MTDIGLDKTEVEMDKTEIEMDKKRERTKFLKLKRKSQNSNFLSQSLP